MKSGLLWFDGSKTPLPQKIQNAARRYKEKFGVLPDTCFVNPRDLPADANALNDEALTGMTVTSKATIIPNHLWLGITQ